MTERFSTSQFMVGIATILKYLQRLKKNAVPLITLDMGEI
jgi:hypothetical protein